MERYKKHFKEASAYVNDFVTYCELQKIDNPTLKDLDVFVDSRKITDFHAIEEIILYIGSIK